MKKCIVILCCIIAIAGHSNAQQTSSQLMAGNMPSLSIKGGINNVHAKAMRDFLKRNKTALQADWIVVDNGYVVKYQDENNLRCRSVYNERGAFQYTIRQYNEDKMNQNVRRLVKSSYYDYSITLIEEVELPLKPVIYIVHVENAGELKNLRVSEGYLEIIEDYRKQ